MYYYKIQWIHDFEKEPFIIYSELDNERYEVRKLELYKNGHFGYATQNTENGGSILSEHPYPSIDEIASNPEFIPMEISREEFEEIWKKTM